MAGNSQRRGAMRNPGSKKGASTGSGGNRKDKLGGRGPTPKAVDRPHHPKAKQKKAAERRAATNPEGSGGRRVERTKARVASLLMGRNSVVEALRAKVPANALYVQSKADTDDRWREAMKTAVSLGIPLMEVPRSELDRMTDGGVHQGLVLTVPEYKYADLKSIESARCIIACDGLTDPRNLGAISRSAAAFGAEAILLPERRSVGVTATAWKSSAGALTRIKVAQVTNLNRSLISLQKVGFTVIGLASEGATPLQEIKADTWRDPVVIVIGAEGAGLSRLVKESCDWLVNIPMAKGNESLNASVAASVVLQDMFRARTLQ
jgi:23S rRNA (guanosine2251-2'-O)-methyltransferase